MVTRAALKATVEALVPTDEESLRIWTVVIAFWGHRPAQSFLAAGIEQGSGRGLRGVLVKSLRDAVSDGDLPAGADVEGEAERLLVLIAGLGFMAGGFEEDQWLGKAALRVFDNRRSVRARHRSGIAKE